MATVTKPMALDETLQATNQILDDIKEALANSSIVGDTDISEIADGTLTGAVAEFDGEISAINTTLDGLGDAATKDVANTYDAESTDPISGQGVAEALETTEVESLSNTTPYLYRKSPAIGSRVMENALVGASVIKNQLVPITAASSSGVTNNGDGSFTVAQGTNEYYTLGLVTVKAGHKYLMINNGGKDSECYLRFDNPQNRAYLTYDGIFECTQDDTDNLWIRAYNTTNQYKVTPVFVDLTQWFGSSTIPDAAYTKEQSTAGSGIAWLKNNGFDFSKYIPNNTGELESVNPSAKKVVGFNQNDEVYENGLLSLASGSEISGTGIRSKNYNACIGGEDYYLYKAEMYASKPLYVFWFDENKAYISNGYKESAGVVTSPSNARFFRLRADWETTSVIICINISKPTGTPKNGDYLPYEEHTIPISEYPLRGLFVLDGDTIKASGDVRKSDGSTEKVRGSVDLGTLSWSYDSTYTRMIATLNGCEVATARTIQYVCEKYVSCNDGRSVVDVPDKSVYNGYEGSNSLVFIKDTSYTDAATFKTAMNGVYLEYPLATPTTESLPPFDNPQISIVSGTEEFVTDNDVPVGHDSEYKKLPPLFEDDYIQTIQERAENVIGEIEDVTPISGTATVTLLHEEDQGEDWIVGFTGEINGHFDTDKFDYYLTARYTHAYNTNTQILNMNNCTDGDYVNIWQTGTLDFSVDGGVTVTISVTSTKLTFTVNCIGDSIFGIYSSSEPAGDVKYLITPARKG